MRLRKRMAVALLAAAMLASTMATPAAPAADEKPLTMAVMDPLAAPLSCDCVKGYAQRKYEKLAEHLERQLKRPVRVVYGEELGRILRGLRPGEFVHLIIGKKSLVEYDAQAARLPVRPLCVLTGKDGDTQLTGLFVVRTADPAQSLADLKGYQVLFGPEDSAEKHAAALRALKQAGIAPPAKPETRGGCSDAAIEVCEGRAPMAAVISSYAVAVLEGCGTIEKGSLRVVGKTEPVPFVTAFATDLADQRLGERLRQALLAAADDPRLLEALESQKGFVALPAEPAKKQSESAPATHGAAPSAAAPAPRAEDDWPGWRGPRRDARVARLPKQLPAEAAFAWRTPLGNQGLGGLAVAGGRVLVPDRDPLDQSDVFRCLDAEAGIEFWKIEYLAPGKLDYGNSPRATPLIADGKVFLLGAFGDLYCAALDDGRVVWKKNLIREFGAKLPTWGMCASPLIVEGRLIVNPGAADAAVVALDPATGKLLWKAPGPPAAYSSFVAGRFGGVAQVVGYDALGLAGYDPQSGKRLWSLLPPKPRDFNVPTPVDLGDRLLLTTENNGTRLYGFDARGAIVANPAAVHLDLAPDSSTPVVVGSRAFGCWDRLFCLDLAGLKEVWTGEDPAYKDYVSLIAGPESVLVTTSGGELLLVDALANEYKLLGRLRIVGEGVDVLAHPALAGGRLYVRIGTDAACLPLDK